MQADQNILSKEEEKVETYQDLALEIKRILLSPAIITIIIVIIKMNMYFFILFIPPILSRYIVV